MDDNIKSVLIGFCVIYTIFSLMSNFKGNEVQIDRYSNDLTFQTHSFWGLESKTYGLSWRNDNWYIYNQHHTDGKHIPLFRF
jgi:hypothetical protein